MNKQIEIFKDHFNDVVESVQKYAIFVRGKEFQEEAVVTVDALISECTQLKESAIKLTLEDEANAYLAFEYMAKALAEEFRFYLALKADTPDLAWDHLVNAQSWSASAMKSHSVASHLDGYIHRLHGLERLLFPQLVFFSTGFIVRESKCNICGSEYGECDHVKQRPYMGKLCGRIITDADIQEISIVSDPADKHCRAIHYTKDNVTRNVLTQRIEVTNETQSLFSVSDKIVSNQNPDVEIERKGVPK